ncbi:MAG: hypothetical protein ACOZIN_08455 [Myxococcota bacterium]
MAAIRGESVRGLKREVVIQPLDKKRGWVRMTIVLVGKKRNLYIVDVNLADLGKRIRDLEEEARALGIK